jgi:Leucine-rich repeat (LRR) protein
LEKLNRLNFLSLTSNHLGSGRTGDLSFLQSLLNTTDLEIMALNDNNFGGILLEFIGNFTWIRIFLLDGNRISGSILNGIENLVNLERMELWGAKLLLSGYRLSGNIPFFRGNLTNLTSLYLG